MAHVDTSISYGDTAVGLRQVCKGAFNGDHPQSGSIVFEPTKYASGLYTYADPDDDSVYAADASKAGEFTFDPVNAVFINEIRADLGSGETYGATVEDHEFVETGISSGELSLTYATAADTITRSGGSFLTDGFKDGDTIRVTGTVNNDGDYTVTNVIAATITVGENLTDEGPVDSTVTGISKHSIEIVASSQSADGTRVSFHPPVTVLPNEVVRITSSGGSGAVTIYAVKADRGI